MSRSSSILNAELFQGPRELECIVERFEEAWQSGNPPKIASFLPAGSTDEAPSSREILEELVKVDLEYRWRRSNGCSTAKLGDALSYPVLENYVRQFPELGAIESISDELIAEEYLVRRKWGDNPDRHDYELRFAHRGESFADRLRRIEAEVVPDTTWKSDTPRLGVPYMPRSSGKASPAIPGSTAVVGDYEILEELGRGGMGVVYKARQRSLDRIVALKMILTPVRAGEEDRSRFRREAEAAARLQHPHIVQIHEVGEQDGHPFFSLEFVDGGSLSKHLAGMPQPPRQSAQLVESVARAMQYAHQRGVIHRDLKPGNILLSFSREPKASTSINDAVPKVSDFGLAKRLDVSDGTTQTGSVLGTPSYMAPEQAIGRHEGVGPASDVYALGAILYEILTGRPPFRGTSILETLEQVRSQEPVAPRQLQPKLPRDIDTICLKCLQKDPRRRYESAEALADDLGRFRRGEPIFARPIAGWERVWKWACRHPAVASLLLVVFVSVVVAAVGTSIYTTRLHEAHEQAKLQTTLAQQAHERAENQRKLAEENLTKAMQSLEHIGLSVFNKGKGGPELEEFKKKLLTDLVIYFNSFVGTAEHPDPEIRRWTGRAYKGLGMCHQLLGQYPEAEAAQRNAVRIYQRLTEEAPQNSIYRHDLACAHCGLGDIFGAQDRLNDAEPSYRSALVLYQSLAGDDKVDLPACFNVGVTSHNWGRRLAIAGQPLKAMEWHDGAIHIMSDLKHRFPNNKEVIATLGCAHAMRAHSMSQLARHQEALQDWDRALELLGDSDPLIHVYRAQALANLGDHERAIAVAEAIASRVTDPALCVDFAGVYALSITAAQRDIRLASSDRQRLIDACTKAAMASLRKAREGGFFEKSETLKKYRDVPEFDSIRSLEEFQAFFAIP